MNATDEMCCMLDELGIKHFDYGHENHVWWIGADNIGWHAESRPSVNGSYVKIEAILTPAQAIAATSGRSCESCPEMDNPDSYIVHLHRALEVTDSGAGTCQNIAELNREGVAGYFFVCSECGLAVHASFDIRETNYPRSKPDGSTDLRTFNSNGKYEFERCPRCGRRIEVSE